jgi:hypothetical protein
MPPTQPVYGPIQGDHGIAVPVVVPPLPDLAPLLLHWLITAPGYNPTRKQWVIAVTTTADLPGFKPCRLDFVGATHEVIIMPLDPDAGEQTPNSLMRRLLVRAVPMLPRDAIYVQVTARENEIHDLAPVLAGAIVRQGWSPDVTSDPGNTRGGWREAIERNLATIRSTPHPAHTTAVAIPAPGTMTPPGGHRQQ